MPLVHRLSRLLTADLHALLDRLEDPETLLAQAERDMREALAEDETRLAQLEAQRDTAANEQRIASSQLETIASELELSLDAGDEALARRVLRRRIKLEHQSETQAANLEALNAQIPALAARIEQQTQALAEVCAETERLRQQPESQRVRDPGFIDPATEEAVELALLAARRARGGAA